MLLHHIPETILVPMENLLQRSAFSSSLHVLSFFLERGLIARFSFQAEISLCRVYKRGGVEHHLSVMHKPSSSKPTRPDKKHKRVHQPSSLFAALAGDSSLSKIEKIHGEGGSSTNNIPVHSAVAPVLNMAASLGEDGISLNSSNTLVPTSTLLPSATSSMAIATADEFSKMFGYRRGYFNQTNQFITMPSQPQLLPFKELPNSLETISDNLWEWNQIHEAGKDFINFK